MGYFNNGIGAARINDSSPSDYTTYSGNKIETKQNSTDNALTTTSKTIVGAINEVNSKVNNKFIIAQTLPISDIDEFAIYLIPKSTAQTNNIYDEYIYISTDTPAHWEKIGDTEIDLSGYYTSSQVDTLLGDKQDATDNSLATTDKTIIGAINENKSVIGYSYDAYDDTATYAVGDLCIYNNALYKCTTAITTAEAWNASHWTATSIADEIAAKANKSNVDNSTVTIARHSSAPSSTPLVNIMRRGHVVIIEFVHKFSAGTYYQLFNVTPLPLAQVHATVWVGAQTNLVTVLANGVVQFNNTTTIAADAWVIGEIVYITAD